MKFLKVIVVACLVAMCWFYYDLIPVATAHYMWLDERNLHVQKQGYLFICGIGVFCLLFSLYNGYSFLKRK